MPKHKFPGLEFSSRIREKLYFWKIDRKELGADTLNSEWRNLRPHNCKCWGTLSPENETNRWYFFHAILCLVSEEKIKEFENQLELIITKQGERFKKEKKQVIETIKQKVQQINYKDKINKDYVFEDNIINCLNNQQLKAEEERHLTYLENLANTWQKVSEAEKEKIKKQEEERIKQEQQKIQT